MAENQKCNVTRHRTQSNPIHGWIQSMDICDPNWKLSFDK